ncbi:MAG TPA: hypothetical protein VGE35_02100 [Candidatus Paceibacterota bacterium]
MGVQFDEGGIPRNYGGSETPKFAAFLISKGWAKDEASANKIQLIAAIVFFAIAIYLAVF